MSISEKQLAANQANAKHCTGPRSLEGKAKSSQNARRHGITAQTTVMTDEDRLHHDDFCNRMIADLAPEGSVEIFHASAAAEQAWRMNHARAHCNNILAIGHFDGTSDSYETEHPEIQTAITAAQVARDRAKTFELLSLYEQRLHRAYEKHYDQLQKLQAERKAKRFEELETARLLSQLAKLQHLPYIPAQDGFVFSNDEIDRHTELHHRLNFARNEDPTYKGRVTLINFPKAA